MWKIIKSVTGFTVGSDYQQVTVNPLNVSLINDEGNVAYVDKKFLVNVGGVYS